MRIHRDGWQAERAVEPDVRSFAANAGKALQFFTGVGYFAAEIFHQLMAEFNNIGSFGVKKADGFDVVFYTGFTKFQHLLRCICGLKEGGCGLIYPGIGSLCREYDCHQKREFIGKIQFGYRGRGMCGKVREYLVDFLSIHGINEHITERVIMKRLKNTIIGAVLLCIPISAPAFAGSGSVYIDDLTWMEVQGRIQSGTSIAIVPTGGNEQEGPQMVTGKHTTIVHYAAGEIAKKLGNALVAPAIPYAPSGRISPPEGHMQFPGTISVTPRAYSLMLADVARSLKQQGFHLICFVGDNMGAQAIQAQVAETLSEEWSTDGVQVLNVTNYYYKNGVDEWNDLSGVKVPNPAAHAGHNETSELMAVDVAGVRDTLRAVHTDRDYKTTGAMGDSSIASANFGRRYVSLKIEAAIKQIQNASSHAR